MKTKKKGHTVKYNHTRSMASTFRYWLLDAKNAMHKLEAVIQGVRLNFTVPMLAEAMDWADRFSKVTTDFREAVRNEYIRRAQAHDAHFKQGEKSLFYDVGARRVMVQFRESLALKEKGIEWLRKHHHAEYISSRRHVVKEMDKEALWALAQKDQSVGYLVSFEETLDIKTIEKALKEKRLTKEDVEQVFELTKTPALTVTEVPREEDDDGA